MNKAEFAALCLAAAMAMTRPDHADFKRALKNAAAERSGWGWAGGMLASAASFLADRVGMFRHRDCLLFSVEHADVAHDKHEVVFVGVFGVWFAIEKSGKVYRL